MVEEHPAVRPPAFQPEPGGEPMGEGGSDVETGSTDRPKAAGHARLTSPLQLKQWAPDSLGKGHFSEITSALKVLCFLPTSARRAEPQSSWACEQAAVPVQSATGLRHARQSPTTKAAMRVAVQQPAHPEDTALPGPCRADARGKKVAGSQVPNHTWGLCSCSPSGSSHAFPALCHLANVWALFRCHVHCPLPCEVNP